MPFADIEAKRSWERARYQKYPEKMKAYADAWRKRNPGYQAKWKSENRDSVVKYRKARRSSCVGRLEDLGLSATEARDLLSSKTHCVLCGDKESKFHLDHIIPRSRGGSNRPNNLQWLCATCNLAKSALNTEEFIAHIKKILCFIEEST